MMEYHRTISGALEIVLIARSAERAGNHAQNMAEYTIYLVKGPMRVISVSKKSKTDAPDPKV